ncbi:hypothetical protein KJ836_03035 [Patescibacteria group bacterium]|nr:hypothetical protein [Patescibacteria group bacterium]
MNFSSEEFAVKSRKGNFGFLATEFGNGIAFGRHPPTSWRMAKQMGGKTIYTILDKPE